VHILTKVTIIIHEGRGGRPHGRRAFNAQPGSEMEQGRHRPHGHGRHGGDVEMSGRHEHSHRHHGHRAFDAQPGDERGHGHHRHHGHDRQGGDAALGGRRGFGRGRPGEWGERPFAGHNHRPDHELSAEELAQRQLARQVRREVRRVLREAAEAGLNPERAARVARRETRRDDYL
jgi:hypothetical protein